ncbi:C2 domain-containing protein 3 [Cololabis saira]|uniref:C2 domain-containing protein 3 n=1 Tax=Cololabis saira TaxID=129043 RepID=UPI002AD356D3|nr:C2 domain-containing protein 3 [Cololabis saira]
MKSRKQKIVKSGSSKSKVPSDVSPSTSLPPLVEGHLRCFLSVTISRVIWTVHKPPPPTFIRLRWWGESSNGTHFFPRDGSQPSQKTIKTTARFPIRCGPKQFTSYLTDMGFLVLEVLSKQDHLPVARAQVAGISRVSLSQPVNGFYTLLSPTSEKLGEVQVSLNLEPLTEAYDSCSPGPAIDINRDRLQVTTRTGTSQHRSHLAVNGKKSAGKSGKTLREKDHLCYQNGQEDKEETAGNQMSTLDNSLNNQAVVNSSDQESFHRQTNNDIISVILDRGNKLRNAMVVSMLKCDMDSALKDTPLPLPKDNIQPPTNKLVPSTSGLFLQDILHADSSQKHSDDVAIVTDCGLGYSADMDKRAVDLLLGSSSTSLPPLWDVQGFSLESLSGHSSLCADSELNDPLYDQSLLENLFYKAPNLDARLDGAEEEVLGTMSPSKNQPKQLNHTGHRINDGPTSDLQPSAEVGIHPALSGEQLALLSSIRLLKVTISSLTVPASSSATAPRNTSNKGKPPPPLTSKKCTYFVEYVFPATLAPNQHDHRNAGDGEVVRAVSRKITGEAVKFHQIATFPVHFSTAAIKHWWETDLIFKIYSRRSDQKKPVAIGTAVYPLVSLLQTRQLSQAVVLSIQNLENNKETEEIGPLKVSFELGKHNKDFQPEKSKKLPCRDASPSIVPPNLERENISRPQYVNTGKEESSACCLEGSRLKVWTPQRSSEAPATHRGIPISPLKSSPQVEEDPEVLLHALLMVPDGKNFSCGPLQAPNVYLNCKLFWCDETARSVVSWGQTNPTFNFVQVTPVALTSKLLERMKNNMIVIEVWQKTGSPGQDVLFGLVKLPLHQFYISFKDPKITQLLLQAQYPVLGVDCYMPIIDVFSGSCRGNLRVVLAMGRSEQIVSLQRTRDEECDPLPHLVRPVHLLDLQPHSQTKLKTPQVEIMREHVFMVRVEKVSGLTPLQSTVWGEADCYIQYTFPCQEGDAAANVDQDLIESSVNLKPFRTTTTLCVPDPVFGHAETHVLLAPEGIPIQRLLLSSLSSQGLSSGGGVQFEVWCRYYYPNVRDQLVARGMLPLSKLCAMVTMQRQHPNEAQMFSLPLIPRMDDPTGFQPHPSGLLDVCIRYKHRPVRTEGQAGRGAASRVVTLVVNVHRACGLKAAARTIAEHDKRFGHFVGEGVNPFVTVQLSFLPESEMRCTRTAARTFCPEFDHHMEVSCDLQLHMSSGETCSLAEQLDQASAVFTVWTKDNYKEHLPRPEEVMLGTVKVPLGDLIHKRTGISGWFGLYLTREGRPSQHQHILVGGLEVSISFAHHSDRERAIKAAQSLGWEVPHDDIGQEEDDESWEEISEKLSVTFSIPRAWIPTHCLLVPGLRELQRSTYCYYRYKFYDQDAFCSRLKHPSVKDGGDDSQAHVSFEGSRTVELRCTRPLMWYLREEKLEVQVWAAFSKNKTRRPSDSDRLVGSAFVDLSSLAKTSKQKLTLSGVYPLFMRSAADLQGAALRVHIMLTAGSVPMEVSAGLHTQGDSDSPEELFLEEVEAAEPELSPTTPRKSSTQSRHKKQSPQTTPDITFVQHTEMSLDDSFPSTVAVEQAMHLNLKGCPLTDRSEGAPCCCVSYVTADSAEPVSTAVVSNTDCPVWDHQHECRLSKELLVDPQQSLVFKVWHKGEMERVIGFASVDLSPLLCGLPSVCGWYNITDFSGQCHGQLKVSITPLRGVQDLRGRRRTVNEESVQKSSTLFQTAPLSYQTTAVYNSFPSHISRYTEQKISSPNHTEQLFSERASETDRHSEHMDKVRLYHQSLQEQVSSHSLCSSATGDINPSSSYLFSTLRKKLSELDNIQRYFSRKLSTPTFPSLTELDCHTQQEEQRGSEIDTSQLLLKSNQLVGEVNDIISGLKGQHLETIPSTTENSSSNSPGEHNGFQIIPASISSPQKVIDVSSEVVSPLPSLPTEMSGDPPDPEPEEERDQRSSSADMSEEEHEEETGFRHDVETDDCEENDEDFEETVVKPRPLNEVTSLTDRTSPWTSILSDPDLASVESMEALQESDCSEDEDNNRQALRLETQELGGKHQEIDPHHSSGGSTGDASDSERDDERTLQGDNDIQSDTPKSHDETSGDPASSLPTEPCTCTSASGPLHNEDAQLQPSNPVEVPNFFLSSHQLEASLRVIRLAPSFSQSPSSPSRSSSDNPGARPRTGPRQRPDMSPSSMKKATERIVKIFAAHLDESS